MKTMYAVPELVVKKYVPHRFHEHIEKMQPNSAYRYVGGVSVSDLAKAEEVKHFDVALPIEWVREFQEVTGFNPVGHFVYDYSDNTYGFPKPVTIDGIIAMRIFVHIRNTRGI